MNTKPEQRRDEAHETPGPDRGQTESDYRKVLKVSPGDAGAMIGLSRILLARGEYNEAFTVASVAVRQVPGDAAAYLVLGAALLQLGWPREAGKAFAKAADLNPNMAGAHSGLSHAQLNLNEIASARTSALRALALDENHAEAWFVLGAAQRALGEIDEAAAALERATALDEVRAAAHLNLGLVYADLERPTEAARSLQRTIELDPRNKDAHIALSSLHYRNARNGEAMIHARLALELDPRLMTAHQNLARLLSEEGREAEAKKHRDLAYTGRNLLTIEAPRAEQRVLVLTTATDGNTPDRYLLPAARYTRIYWFIEYASEAQFAELPPYDVVFNEIADPDLSSATTRNVARFQESCSKRIINDPRRIADTCRHMTPALLGDIDNVVTPLTVRIAADEAAQGLGLSASRAGLSTPLLVRPIGSHGGEGLVLAEDETAEVLHRPAAPTDYYLTAFHDFRASDGFYRKYRVFFIDRRPYPYHLAISSSWMVHYVTSGMGRNPAHMMEELSFLEDPESAIGTRAYGAVHAIGKRIDLDFCGLDFSVLPDGRVLVFEANATMLVHPEPPGPFAYKNRFVEQILQAFREMLARP